MAVCIVDGNTPPGMVLYLSVKRWISCPRSPQLPSTLLPRPLTLSSGGVKVYVVPPSFAFCGVVTGNCPRPSDLAHYSVRIGLREAVSGMSPCGCTVLIFILPGSSTLVTVTFTPFVLRLPASSEATIVTL